MGSSIWKGTVLDCTHEQPKIIHPKPCSNKVHPIPSVKQEYKSNTSNNPSPPSGTYQNDLDVKLDKVFQKYKTIRSYYEREDIDDKALNTAVTFLNFINN